MFHFHQEHYNRPSGIRIRCTVLSHWFVNFLSGGCEREVSANESVNGKKNVTLTFAYFDYDFMYSGFYGGIYMSCRSCVNNEKQI